MSSPSIAILKIGGSVLVDAAAYARAAAFVDQRLAEEPGAKLVVVVSAEQGVTDALLEIARGMCSAPDPRMVDLLWSTGELKAVALLALALQSRGVRATGINVHQTGPDGSRWRRGAWTRALPPAPHLRGTGVARGRGRSRIPGPRRGRRRDVTRPRRFGSDSRPPGRRPRRQPVRAHQGCLGLLLGRSQSPSGRAPRSGHHLQRRAGDGRRWLRARPARGTAGGATALGSSSRAFDCR